MAAPEAPCSWDPIPCGCDLPGYGEDVGGDPPDDETRYAVETASYVLWALSGRQFGCCERTFRPCRRDCRSGLEDSPWGARLVSGAWVNLPCRSCRGECSCVDVNEVRIPGAPVCEITEVVLDGVTLDADQYWLEDAEWLVLRAGAGSFPDCQDFSVPYGEAGSYGFVASTGTPPPTAGRRAVGALACEILKACRGGDCQLPKRTQSMTRSGRTVVLLDPMEFFDKGRTGIYEVDLFLNAANPLNRPAGARVMSPDSVGRQHDVWPEV